MKSLFEQKGGTYTKVGDYYLPNLSAAGDNYKIGKYGRARRNDLKKHRKSEYTALMIPESCTVICTMSMSRHRRFWNVLSRTQKNPHLIRQRTKWNGLDI